MITNLFNVSANDLILFLKPLQMNRFILQLFYY
jgi:hypothetical protein